MKRVILPTHDLWSNYCNRIYSSTTIKHILGEDLNTSHVSLAIYHELINQVVDVLDGDLGMFSMRLQSGCRVDTLLKLCSHTNNQALLLELNTIFMELGLGFWFLIKQVNLDDWFIQVLSVNTEYVMLGVLDNV